MPPLADKHSYAAFIDGSFFNVQLAGVQARSMCWPRRQTTTSTTHTHHSQMTTRFNRCPMPCLLRQEIRSPWHFSTVRRISGGHDLWRSLGVCPAQDIFRPDLRRWRQRVFQFGASAVESRRQARILITGGWSIRMLLNNLHCNLPEENV